MTNGGVTPCTRADASRTSPTRDCNNSKIAESKKFAEWKLLPYENIQSIVSLAHRSSFGKPISFLVGFSGYAITGCGRNLPRTALSALDC